jgi:GDP-4-dehydro-6-deoxy-D-mannose reductase
VSGFVGRHLVDVLSLTEAEVFGTCFPEKPDACLGMEDLGLFHVDMRDEKGVLEAVEKTQPDWIFHLAAVSNVGYSWRNRKETVETNLMGTFFLFEAVKKVSPQSRLLFVSSCDVYGGLSPLDRALEEEDATSVVSPYAFTKLSGELLSQFYSEIEGLDIVVARSFPHTGPGQSADFVFSDWAYQIARIEKGKAEPVIQVGNLDVRRDYSDVRDVVRAYVLLLENGKKGEIYNVCSGQSVSLQESLNTLLSFSDKNIQIKSDADRLRKADLPFLLGSFAKIEQDLGWQPEIPLKQSLEDLLDYWRQR